MRGWLIACAVRARSRAIVMLRGIVVCVAASHPVCEAEKEEPEEIIELCLLIGCMCCLRLTMLSYGYCVQTRDIVLQ